MSINVSEVLAQAPLFKGLTEEQCQQLAALMFVNDLAAEDVVCQEGDNSDFMCLVAEGALDILKRNAAGHIASVARCYSGDVLGEMTLLDGKRRSATLVALEPTTLLVLTKKTFEQFRQQQPYAASVVIENIARQLSENMRRTSARLATFMTPLL